MKAVVAAFNQEKAPVGAFFVSTNLWMELFQALLQTAHLVLVLHVGHGRGVLGEAAAGVAAPQLAQVGGGDGQTQVGVAAPALTSHHARGGGGATLHPALRHTQLRGRGRGRHQRRLVEQGAV